MPYSDLSVLISVRFVLSALTVCSGSLHLGVVLRCFCPVCQLKSSVRLNLLPRSSGWDLAIYSIIVLVKGILTSVVI